ncbi:MAG: endoglucanase [Actinomycetota bacterium]|jgi:hypothetical protein
MHYKSRIPFRRYVAGLVASVAAVAMLVAGQAATERFTLIATANTVTADGRFHVVGTSIIGPDGQTFTPRGANKNSLEVTSTGWEMKYWYFQRMKSWGANFVRLPLSPSFGLPSMCTYDPNYLARIDWIVKTAQDFKMMVLLDNHASTQGRTCGSKGWTATNFKMADERSLEFMQLLANRYKDNPYVAFDLFNEPHDIPWSVWRNGGMVDGWKAAGMQQMLNAVRSTGATNLVFVSGNQWGNDLRVVGDYPLANDGNVVYAAHTYPIYCNSTFVPWNEPYSCNGKQYPAFLDTMVAPAAAKRAVMITEFGTKRPIAGEVASVIDWAENHKIGWAAWLWCQGAAETYCLLVPGYEDTASVTGQPVRDALAPYKSVA